MKNNKLVATMITLIALFSLSFQAQAGETKSGAKIGVLTCITQPNTGISLIIHSTTDVKCSFSATGGGGVENYVGETGVGLGIDMRFDRETHLVYTVLAVEKVGSYKLAGKYVGGGASVTVGAGVGAQVLIGGNDKSISLQPVIEGSTGLGISAGITYLFLQPDKGSAAD
ncbi:DUF992 domain-containing protein [Mariprofundus sp. NF]|jgi:hypothetical protein|uniref:DUF992 domain-containing protein n=1 Tax=Mariprofundus sp. NF TaxID=2608716 RepID=UPI0015A1412A|nr:DUF992 domain-containing protein [Mariprofundus sp. NF]NWF39865.1 DUF992 domain-containing protein [Mariprofundus sp. NF]